MLERMKKHPTDKNIVEIIFSSHQRYRIPARRVNEIIHFLESLKYVKKVEDGSSPEWVSLDEILEKEAPTPQHPGGVALIGARKKEGYSQVQLAKLMGLRQENISKMENGKRAISLKMAKRLGEVLNIDYRIFLV